MCACVCVSVCEFVWLCICVRLCMQFQCQKNLGHLPIWKTVRLPADYAIKSSKRKKKRKRRLGKDNTEQTRNNFGKVKWEKVEFGKVQYEKVTHFTNNAKTQTEYRKVQTIFVQKSFAWNIGDIDIRGQFHQCSTNSFCTRRFRKRKKDWQLDRCFCAFEICTRKTCS